jgi:hypothetical protein
MFDIEKNSKEHIRNIVAQSCYVSFYTEHVSYPITKHTNTGMAGIVANIGFTRCRYFCRFIS